MLLNLRSSEIHLFYNLGDFYWHFLEILWLFIFLFLYSLFPFFFRDLLRELNKKYEVLLIILFLVFLLFLVSEGLLFVSFFWTSFHYFWKRLMAQRNYEKERCSGSYRQAVSFLVIKDDSISERPG